MYGYWYNNLFKSVSSESTPEAIGTIFDINTSDLANLDDFSVTTTGTTAISLDSGYIKFSGIPAVGPVYPLTNKILYDGYVTGLPKWTFVIEYIVKSYNTSAEGLCTGFFSDVSLPFKRDDWYIHWRDSNDASFNGKVWATQQGTGANDDFATTTAVTNAVDDEYRMTLDYDNGLFTVTLENLTQAESESGSIYNYTYAYPWSAVDMSSSRMMMGHLSGEHWVSKIKLTSTEQKNVDYIVLGDSMTMGYGTTSLSDRWLDEVVAANPLLTFTKSACINDEPETAVNKADEINLINASKAILFIGINGVIQDGDASTRIQFEALTDVLESAGIDRSDMIIINCPPYDGNGAMNTFNTWLDGEYTTATIIDVNTEFNDGSDYLDATYDCGDGIHPNDLGNTWISDQVNLLI